MGNDKSRDKLLEFLDYVASKGLMPKNTILSRKAAAGKVLGILKGAEAEDVTALDLNDVMKRFQNLEGTRYTPSSLTVYLSRTKSAIDDFKSYLENPLAFRPNVQTRAQPKREASTAASKNNSSSSSERAPTREPLSGSILPIQIRPDSTVFVQGLPYDLSEAEATKIANVIKAHVLP